MLAALTPVEAAGAALGGVAAIASGGAVYLAARRRMSGGIRTSEAATLWTEATNIRRELREELAGVLKELAKCEETSRLQDCKIDALADEIAALRAELARLRGPQP